MRASSAGVALVLFAVGSAVAAPLLAPHRTGDWFPDPPNAPPTVPHIVDDGGEWHAPFIYPWKLASRLERYEQDCTSRVPLLWFNAGRVVSSDAAAPLMLLGGDSYGGDVFSRLLFGGRISLGLSLIAALGALAAGGVIGALAGYVGGTADDLLMRGTDVVMVLPAIYVALALRAVLPLVLPPSTVFLFLAAIFAVLGAPFVARGVRGIVRTERQLEYAVAAASLGAGHMRLLGRHLLPAARGFLFVELTLLLPSFIVAEATLSYVGLGFTDPVTTWGTMLSEASNVRTLTDFPWLLSPAAAIFLFVLGVNLSLEGRSKALHYN